MPEPDRSVAIGSLRLKNPVICASGEPTMTAEGMRAAIDAGAGAVVAKSTNESDVAARQLDVADYVLLDVADYVLLDDRWRPIPRDATAPPGSSLLCRSGLVQVPFEEWLATLVEVDRYARAADCLLAASPIVADLEATLRMAGTIEQAGLRWLEVNIGAPHAEEAAPGAITLERDAERVREITRRTRAAVGIPLSIKLAGQTDNVLALVGAAREAGADAVILAGRFLGFLPDLETRRPVLGTFGAVGGGWALPLTLRWIAKARQRFGADLPIIGTNGARSGGDVARFLLSGARAVQLCSVVMTEGYGALSRCIRELAEYVRSQGLERPESLIGRAADAALTYAEARRSGAGAARWEVVAGRTSGPSVPSEPPQGRIT
jgi:dihydroorotate dehydrogenase (NAD+) catalytic subunit